MKIMEEVQKIASQGEFEFPLLSETRWPVIPSTSLIPGFVLVFVVVYTWVFTHETQNQNSPQSEALLCQVSLEVVPVLPGDQA